MGVVQPATATEFLEGAGPALREDEARHNLILGIAGTLRDHPALYPEHTFWLVEQGGTVAASALRTHPFNLVLGHGSAAAMSELAASIDQDLPGVVGGVPEVDDFVAAWTASRDVSSRVDVSQGIYALDTVIHPPPPEGAARAATTADRPLLVDWWGAFGEEALGAFERDDDRNGRNVDHRLEAPGNGIALWEVGGEPVSAVGFGSETPTGTRIGPVYTPPEHRGRGYASALTAHVSQERLDAGRRFCFLYTDLGNPTSNKIYVAIGYRRVCDSIQYAFV